jgi:hypothetical protein
VGAIRRCACAQVLIDGIRAANRTRVMQRTAANLPTSRFCGASFVLDDNMYRVMYKVGDAILFFGYFDDEVLAAKRADEVAAFYGADWRNFDPITGAETGYDSSVAMLANLKGAKDRKSRYRGVSYDAGPKAKKGHPWFARVTVPDCRKRNRACVLAAAGKKVQVQATPPSYKRLFSANQELQAAMAWDRLVFTYDLDRLEVNPLVPNLLTRADFELERRL